MIEVKEAVPQDLEKAQRDLAEAYWNDELVACCTAALSRGAAVTLSGPDGSVGCIVGLNRLWPGVASAWSITTRHLGAFPVAYTRAARRLLEAAMSEHGLHRVEITVHAGFPAGQRWARALGFEVESTLAKYGSDGSDFIMYRRLR